MVPAVPLVIVTAAHADQPDVVVLVNARARYWNTPFPGSSSTPTLPGPRITIDSNAGARCTSNCAVPPLLSVQVTDARPWPASTAATLVGTGWAIAPAATTRSQVCASSTPAVCARAETPTTAAASANARPRTPEKALPRPMVGSSSWARPATRVRGRKAKQGSPELSTRSTRRQPTRRVPRGSQVRAELRLGIAASVISSPFLRIAPFQIPFIRSPSLGLGVRALLALAPERHTDVGDAFVRHILAAPAGHARVDGHDLRSTATLDFAIPTIPSVSHERSRRGVHCRPRSRARRRLRHPRPWGLGQRDPNHDARSNQAPERSLGLLKFGLVPR